MELRIPTIYKAVSLMLTATVMYEVTVWFTNYIKRVRRINKIKGPRMLPIIGNMHIVKGRKEWLNQLTYYSNKYKDEPFWRVWFGWNPIMMFHRAEALDILLSNQTVITKSIEYTFLEPWLRKGVITSNGEKWHARRRMITPAFHFEILDDFLDVMNEQADILTENLAKMVRAGEEIDIFKKLQLCTLDVISETAMGQNVNAQNDEESDYVKAMTKICELILARIINPAFWPDWIFNMSKRGSDQKKCIETLQKFTRRVIMQRNADFDVNSISKNKRHTAFLDIMLRAKHDDPTITFDDVQEEVDTFMFAGVDSTATAACWACHLIGWHPEVQKKLHEEIDGVLGNTNRALNKDDIKKLDYLECVVKETLRLFPSIPFFGRVMTEDVQVGDYKLAKGDSVLVVIYAVHRDEKYFPNPEKFDPDRFLPENCKDRHPFSYIPFAAGRRNCIGQKFAKLEDKVLLANILRKFEIKSIKTTVELNPMAEIVARPFSGMPIQLKIRV